MNEIVVITVVNCGKEGMDFCRFKLLTLKSIILRSFTNILSSSAHLQLYTFAQFYWTESQLEPFFLSSL